MASIKFQIDASKLRKIVRAQKAKRRAVDVGVFADAGAYPDGTPVTDVALYNEYGTALIPSRSWLRSTFDESAADISRWIQSAVERELVDLAKGLSPRMSRRLSAIGRNLAERARKKVLSSPPPPNAPSTIARKGHGQTLYETGLLSRSVTHRVPRGA
jgi:hypothetical protein